MIAIGALKFVTAELVIVSAVNPAASLTPAAPKIPPTFTAPVPAFKVNDSSPPPVVPFVAPVIVIAPAPAAPCVDKVTSAFSAITKVLPKERRVLVVVMLLARLAAPLVEKPPGAVIAPVAFLVKSPELVTATAPVEVRLLLTLKAVPVNEADPTLAAPFNVVATDPAD